MIFDINHEKHDHRKLSPRRLESIDQTAIKIHILKKKKNNLLF